MRGVRPADPAHCRFAGRAVTDDAVGSVQFDAFGDGGAADVGGGLRLARRLTQNGAGQGDNDQVVAVMKEVRGLLLDLKAQQEEDEP